MPCGRNRMRPGRRVEQRPRLDGLGGPRPDRRRARHRGRHRAVPGRAGRAPRRSASRRPASAPDPRRRRSASRCADRPARRGGSRRSEPGRQRLAASEPRKQPGGHGRRGDQPPAQRPSRAASRPAPRRGMSPTLDPAAPVALDQRHRRRIGAEGVLGKAAHRLEIGLEAGRAPPRTRRGRARGRCARARPSGRGRARHRAARPARPAADLARIAQKRVIMRS